MLDLKLERYAKSDDYPFHMPGHKRKPLAMPNPYTIDITEIDGFDNLHRAEGILKEAQERAAGLYGASSSYFLVNGSTCGILAAISAALPRQGTILMARNAHQAMYHAAYIRSLSTVYLNPCITAFGVQGAVSPEEIRQKLEQYPQIGAVAITSPTYEGVVSDIAAIARIVHRHQIPLIVDEAHGAHFGFHEMFPETAVRQGADLVIQSLHKTLPSFTQTALLHLNSAYVLPDSIEKFLKMYQTSSPSYVLMAGIEKCLRMIKEQGTSLFNRYSARLCEFYRQSEKFAKIHIMQRQDFFEKEIYDLDPSKLVISVKNTNMSGTELYQKLRMRYRLQMEMSSGFYVLGMTSILDRDEGFVRLSDALYEIDAALTDMRQDAGFSLIRQLYVPRPKKREFFLANDLPVESVLYDEAPGRVSGCMVSIYQPGIPILLPGEVIDAEFIKNIRECTRLRLNLQGIADIINERIDVIAD